MVVEARNSKKPGACIGGVGGWVDNPRGLAGSCHFPRAAPRQQDGCATNWLRGHREGCRRQSRRLSISQKQACHARSAERLLIIIARGSAGAANCIRSRARRPRLFATGLDPHRKGDPRGRRVGGCVKSSASRIAVKRHPLRTRVGRGTVGTRGRRWAMVEQRSGR